MYVVCVNCLESGQTLCQFLIYMPEQRNKLVNLTSNKVAKFAKNSKLMRNLFLELQAHYLHFRLMRRVVEFPLIKTPQAYFVLMLKTNLRTQLISNSKIANCQIKQVQSLLFTN